MLDLPRDTAPGSGDRALTAELDVAARPALESGNGAASRARTAPAQESAAVYAGASARAAEPVLLCERVSKWYGPVIGVNQVTLELRSGVTGLVGANGAGKSTLMRLITGQLLPDIGRVSILGHDSWSAAAKRQVGYCPEIDSFYEEMSGRQFVQAMARLCGYSKTAASERTEQALELVGMSDRANRRVRGYSKGMRQRVKMAQALLNDPALLVLDEPLSGIAAVGTVAEIRDRLDNHPLSIRLDVRRLGPGGTGDRQRDLAAALLRLPDVVGVELLDDSATDEDCGRVLVRARNPQRFFADLTRLVLEEWFEVQNLETIDDSAGAVLDYLLGGK